MTLKHDEWFRFARYKLRVGQTALGKKLGITQSAISRIECGTRKPVEATWIALAGLLNVTLDEYAKGPPT